MEKLVSKPVMKSKSKKKSFDSYNIYIYKVLRTINTDMGISRQAMAIMNNFVVDTMENIAMEASRLVAKSKKSTMGSRDIQAATKLVVPGELSKHAHIEAVKAITKYHSNQDAVSQEFN